LSGQPALATKNGIKLYFAFILAVIISAAYILFLVIQRLEEMWKETKASVDNPEKFKGKGYGTSQVYLN